VMRVGRLKFDLIAEFLHSAYQLNLSAMAQPADTTDTLSSAGPEEPPP
jgi:hypothetical protein